MPTSIAGQARIEHCPKSWDKALQAEFKSPIGDKETLLSPEVKGKVSEVGSGKSLQGKSKDFINPFRFTSGWEVIWREDLQSPGKRGSPEVDEDVKVEVVIGNRT